MDSKTLYQTVENMEKFGGSFVASLANCWRHADPINRGYLETTFWKYFQEYHPEQWPDYRIQSVYQNKPIG